MIEIDINKLHKSEQVVHVKGHQTKSGYVKPYIRIVKAKTATEAAAEMDVILATLQNYKDAAAKTNKWITDNPDRSYDVGEVNNFTVEDYDVINTALRDEFTEDELSDMMIGDQIKSISAFLKDAPKFNGVTYRGMGFDPGIVGDKLIYDNFIDDIKNNEFITLPAFTSTTVKKEIAMDFSGRGVPKHSNRIILEIKSKNGVALDGAAAFSKEMEVLFDKASDFKIISIEAIDGVYNVKLEEL